MGQPSMPEIREFTQLLYQELAMLRSWSGPRGVVGVISYGRQHPAIAALPAVISAAVPHAAAPVIVSIVVTALAGLMGKYLLFYARNRRARSIAEIRRAAIKGKIPILDAEKLIRADMQADADPDQPEESAETGNHRSDDGEGAPGSVVLRRVTRFLRRFRLT